MIYLDNNATTKPSPRVIEAMLPYLSECYFNASASTAAFTGADKPRREAAIAMSKLMNAEEPDCFAFTSGATESNNWVLYSATKGRKGGNVVISTVEHASISEPSAELARRGFKVIEIPVDDQGIVQLDALEVALNDETALVSIMAGNNETGVLEPIPAVGQLIRERSPNALFHTDATQAIGKIPVDLQTEWQDVDLVSFSAHKFHGPKGIGGLYIRPGLKVEPMLLGGGQERGLRSGTTNTSALAGLAAAASEALDYKWQAVRELRDAFEATLREASPVAVIHSRNAPRLPNTSCFSLPAVIGEDMAASLATLGVIVGTGSACSAGALGPSRVLRSMGVPHDVAIGTVRVSLSRFSKPQDITNLIVSLTKLRHQAALRTWFAHDM